MRYGKLVLMGIILMLTIAACGGGADNAAEPTEEELDNLNDENEFPIVKDEVTLDIFAGVPPQSADDWNDVMVWNEYEDMTNVNVDWETVQSESLEEQRNLTLGSNDLPDAFYSAGIPQTDVLKYGEQGVFIPLNDLIDEHAPNLKKLFEESPEIESAITLPDGNIYSMPTLFDEDFTSVLLGPRPWISADVLETVDMEMPETTEEYYEFLKAVKEDTDKIPFGSYSIDMLLRWINGSFGLANKGFSHPHTDIGSDGELRFVPASDEYKEMLEYVHKLYEEELIEQNIFQEGTTEQFLANASDEEYASTVSHDPLELFNIDSMESAPALEGPYGDRLMTGVSSNVTDLGGFVVTNENENPATTIRWIDHFFGDDGVKLFFMGLEGETYEETSDGEVEYLDKITNSSEGLTFEQELAKYLVWPGGAYAGLVLKEDYFKGIESSPASLESAENLEEYMIDEIWPPFTHTNEESSILSTTGRDIEKYVEEMRDKFIVGDEPFSEWDNYIEKLENMGLDEYMKVKNDALERFEEN